jgi:adenine-specific DNA methylase
MTMDDIKSEGMAARLGTQMTAVIEERASGKAYRLPTGEELLAAEEAAQCIEATFQDIPLGLPTEPITEDAKRNTWCVPYGVNQWHKLFTARQLLALGTLVRTSRAAQDAMRSDGYPAEWVEAISAFLAVLVDRVADRNSTAAWWQTSAEKVGPTFTHWALPMAWDFVEIVPWADISGGYIQAIDWVRQVVSYTSAVSAPAGTATSILESATRPLFQGDVDLVVTDPPYYDAIGYSVLMDFYYVWLRRSLWELSPQLNTILKEPLGPKWDHDRSDGELVDDASRHDWDGAKSKAAYEDGMFRAFHASYNALRHEGRMVIVFAHKEPAAWETLVASMIRAGFVVEASWPIQTERVGRVRSVGSAALSSSVWLVCRKRPEAARPGWDTQVLEEMRSRIYDRLRDFWDAGIRGPDFVWAATGPALEAYSKHPVVKKADEPNAVLTVSEFLRHVRRIVVDYVVGRVLSQDGESEEATSLDNPTIYYLLHRHDFGFAEAPVGACILYAQSCNLRDRDLADRHDLVAFTSGKAAEEEEPEDEDAQEAEDEEEERGSGSKVRLKRWEQRRGKSLGLDAEGRPAPLIDQVHRIMRLWREGDVRKVDDYMEERGLRRNPLFPRLLQALVELARKDNQSEERALLETIMNHVTARGAHPQMRLMEAEEEP